MANNTAHPRPVFRNIHVTEIVRYRLPPAGMGVDPAPRQRRAAVPAAAVHHLDVRRQRLVRNQLWRLHGRVHRPAGWFVKLVALALIWAYLHHFIAGVRHLWMDMTHSVTSEFRAASRRW